MKKLKILGLVILVSLHISSCEKSKKEELLKVKSIKQALPVKQEVTKVKVELSSEYKAFLQGYEKLHQSFFEFDKEKVLIHSKKVIDLANNVTDEKLKSQLVHASEPLVKITSDMNKENMNQQFHLFTKNLMNLDEEHDFTSDYSVYYCPMVKKNWLQSNLESDEVRNPYDASMKKCGVKKS